MSYFYEYIPNLPNLPIYIIEAESWKESNRIFRSLFNFKEKNKHGFVWMPQTKETPNFKVPIHLEQYPIKDLIDSDNISYNEFRILYLDGHSETLKKKL